MKDYNDTYHDADPEGGVADLDLLISTLQAIRLLNPGADILVEHNPRLSEGHYAELRVWGKNERREPRGKKFADRWELLGGVVLDGESRFCDEEVIRLSLQIDPIETGGE